MFINLDIVIILMSSDLSVDLILGKAYMHGGICSAGLDEYSMNQVMYMWKPKLN